MRTEAKALILKMALLLSFSIAVIPPFVHAQTVTNQKRDSLVKKLKDPDAKVRQDAAWALGNSADKAAVPSLIAALKDPDNDVRSEAAWSLGRLRDKTAVQPLIAALKDPVASVRFSAARSLGELGDKAAVPPLIDALKDPDKDIRLEAAKALGNLGDKSAVSPLVAALKDPEKDTRCAAAEALGKLGWHETPKAIINECGPTSGEGMLPPPPPLDLKGGEQYKLLWNIWAEKGNDLNYSPVTQLLPKTNSNKPEYTIYIHLSNYSYEGKGFVTLKLGDKLKDIISEQIRTSTDKMLKLQLILIPDANYFEPLPDPVKTMIVNLDNISAQLKPGCKIEGKPLDLLKKAGELPEFVFGTASFSGIKTRDKEGTGYIGLAIWHKGKPIEDFSLPYCISATGCKGNAPDYSSRARGSLPMNSSPPPAASLHFFGLGSDSVVGIFWNSKESDKFPSWVINRKPSEFYKYFSDTIVQHFNDAKTEEELYARGSEFFNFLFHMKGNEAIELRFKEYVKKHLQKNPFGFKDPPLDPKDPPFSTKDLPLLYVQFTENTEGLPFVIPAGLIAVDVGDGKKEFIGFHFKVEAPLKYEYILNKPACIKRWVVTLPKTEKMKKANEPIDNDTITTWTQNAIYYQSIKSFNEWINDPKEDNAPTVIVVMAHHGKNILSDGQSSLSSSGVSRIFSRPSVVILDGCGTMEPGSTDFIKQFNENGVSTVIATSTSIDETMGGDFINCLASVAKATDQETTRKVTISTAFSRSLSCLYKKNPNYGVNVLRYSFLGDGDLNICVPQKEGGK